MQSAGDDQALHDAGVAGTDLGPTKQPIAPPLGITQRAFEVVGVDRHIRLIEEDLHSICESVSRRFRSHGAVLHNQY